MRKMGEAILVNLHTHTIFSDGEQTPEALAAGLDAAGVRYAALTDHDTIEGLTRCQAAVRKRGGFEAAVRDPRVVELLPGLTAASAGRLDLLRRNRLEAVCVFVAQHSSPLTGYCGHSRG